MQEYRAIRLQRSKSPIKQGQNDDAKMAVSSCYTPLPPLPRGVGSPQKTAAKRHRRATKNRYIFG